MKNPVRSILWLAAAFMLAGCTSVSTRRAESDIEKNNGLVYSLPNRMIDVQVDFSDSGEHKITIKGGNYYPDAAETSRYVARIHKGKIGSIKAKLTTSSGLLATADAAYTGQATEFGEALGSAMGVVHGAGLRDKLPKDDPDHCKRKLTLTHSVPLTVFDDDTHTFNVMGGTAACARVTLTISSVGTVAAQETPTQGKRPDGLWYRIELPYVVTATLGDGITASALVMLPDKSPPYFVEMDSGIFADTDNKMAFTNGILTSYEKNNDSEAISLLKLPAGVIAAYAKSVGEVFSNFSTADKHEINAEVAKLNQELLLRKLEACSIAIAQEQPAETINALCNIQPLP